MIKTTTKDPRFLHFSSFSREKKILKRNSFQNAQCRFVSLLRFYTFSVVYATKLPRPSEKLFDFFHVWFIFRYITLNILHGFFLFFPNIFNSLFHSLSLSLKVKFFCCASNVYMFCVYLYISLLFPLIVFNSWKLQATNTQSAIALPLPESQNILWLHWKIHFV